MSHLLSIGDSAFENCSLENTPDLYLPNCTTISDNAFRNTKIKNIHSLGLDCIINGSWNGGAFRNSTLETINLENVSDRFNPNIYKFINSVEKEIMESIRALYTNQIIS